MIEVNKQEPLIRQARRRLAELFPDDYSVYEKWEQYKEIYASAYRSAPNNMDKIIEYWIDTMSPYDHGVHHSELVFPLNVLNNTIATGYGKQHLYDIVRIIAPPQSYAIIYLLWQCNSISNDERLKRAKKDFLDRGYTDEDADIIRDYDINLETLQEWRHDEPERPLSHRMFGANPTINAGALQCSTVFVPITVGIKPSRNHTGCYQCVCDTSISVVTHKIIKFTYYFLHTHFNHRFVLST